MPPTYPSGEQVQSGDRILYHGESGQVEFVANREDPQTGWYVEQFGDGCMILTPSFGRVFVTETEQDEDLELIARRVPSELA